MSTRHQRLNPLLRRELSDLLHSRYRDDVPGVTVLEVTLSPDQRNARVIYSVLGAATTAEQATEFFRTHGETLRREMGVRVVTKFLPQYAFVRTDAVEVGARVLDTMDRLGLGHNAAAAAALPVPVAKPPKETEA